MELLDGSKNTFFFGQLFFSAEGCEIDRLMMMRDGREEKRAKFCCVVVFKMFFKKRSKKL
jgi:hypothetical protein